MHPRGDPISFWNFAGVIAVFFFYYLQQMECDD